MKSLTSNDRAHQGVEKIWISWSDGQTEQFRRVKELSKDLPDERIAIVRDRNSSSQYYEDGSGDAAMNERIFDTKIEKVLCDPFQMHRTTPAECRRAHRAVPADTAQLNASDRDAIPPVYRAAHQLLSGR